VVNASGTLTPEQVKRVVARVLDDHALAERQREALVACTEVGVLRDALVEAGLPPEDVDRSLASIDDVLERPRRRRNLFIAAALSTLLAAGAVALWLSRPAAKPTVFVNISRELPGRAATTSWRSGVLRGATARALLPGFRGAGLRVIERLDARVVSELFVGAAAQPSQAKLRQTAATLAALGTLRCVREPRGYKAALSLQIIDVRSGTRRARANAETTIEGRDAERTCAEGGVAAARAVITQIVQQLGAASGGKR